MGGSSSVAGVGAWPGRCEHVFLPVECSWWPLIEMHVVGLAEERGSWIQTAAEALTGSRKRLKVFSVSRWGKEQAYQTAMVPLLEALASTNRTSTH